ncbi:hypothetical protein NQ314_009776 [Rhamnusium bicolor]|uniref:Uncharacterized protein n=1 Tax=Rhamnusium bicolor TaxID=1586634 RepID=A0AAV8XWD1_9CUCU|nr:hypothetical protein NQ314_009776 [Rhamnusium bicolor]
MIQYHFTFWNCNPYNSATMNSFALAAFFVVFAAANASILAPSLYSAPLAYSAPVVSPYAAPVVAGGVVGEQIVVAGPSGTIATGRTLAAPFVGAYGAPGVIAARSYLY